MRLNWVIPVLLAMGTVDIIVWIGIDRIVAKMPRRRIWRAGVATTFLLLLAFVALTILAPHTLGRSHAVLPADIPAGMYIWHFIVLPVTATVLVIAKVTGGVSRLIGWMRGGKSVPCPPRSRADASSESTDIVASRTSANLSSQAIVSSQAKVSAPPAIPVEASVKPPENAIPFYSTRRQFLTAAALAIPPIATFSLTRMAMNQIGQFRVKPWNLSLPGWPVALDGLTMGVVADVHTGIFSTEKMLRDIADVTNNLRADVILLAGDLLNLAIGDLPGALDMVKRLDAPLGVYMIQGNHDVIEDPVEFNRASRAAGVRLLVDEVETISARGAAFQLLGTRWSGGTAYAINDAVTNVNQLRDPALFPILLAHHPHAWDAAGPMGIPLVIAGHTHGGQIMFTDKIGGGPIRFKYWTGLHQNLSLNSQLLISNGVGNWFPLRVNAPAEILHVTLRRG